VWGVEGALGDVTDCGDIRGQTGWGLVIAQ
jgi:hypothetical protein